MKKIFALGYILLFSVSFLLAETTAVTAPPAPPSSTPSTVTTTQGVLPNKTSSTIDGITRNIDRRLAYFNRYVQSHEIENIQKLVSQDDPNFYTNFIKYVANSAVFTLDRDTTQKIIKTPLDEYMFSAIMALGSQKTKVSITFIEEKSTQGSMWLIKDSNLQIVVPLVMPVGGNLGSSALTPSLPSVTPGNTPPTQPTPLPAPTEAQPINPTATIDPPVNSDIVVREGVTEPVAQVMPISTTQTSSLLIWGIIGGIILVAIILLFIVKKGMRKMAPMVAPVAAGGLLTPLQTTIPPAPLPIPATPTSNVHISTVDTLPIVPIPPTPQEPPHIEPSVLPEAPLDVSSSDSANQSPYEIVPNDSEQTALEPSSEQALSGNFDPDSAPTPSEIATSESFIPDVSPEISNETPLSTVDQITLTPSSSIPEQSQALSSSEQAIPPESIRPSEETVQPQETVQQIIENAPAQEVPVVANTPHPIFASAQANTPPQS